MAIKIPIITELQDAGIKAAKREFDKFKGAVADAEGGMNKFKAGSKSIMDSVKNNAATFATAAAGAFATFAVNGINAFQDLAIAADKFAGATGLAVDEASRLLEVTGDLNIDAGTVETAIGKMNQNLGKSPDLFKELGVQVAYAKDGTVDANETFLNVIDRLNKIKDPATKARIATQLLGKGWRDMSQLISMGADDLRASLASVSDAKTITPAEAEKAKKFRDTMNDLKDVVEDLSIQIGEVLVPAIQEVVDQANKLQVVPAGGGFLQSMFGETPTQKFLGQMNMVKGVLGAFGIEFNKTKDETKDSLITDEQVRNMKNAADELGFMNQHLLDTEKYGKQKPIEKLSTAASTLATELKNVNEAWDILVGKFQENVAFDRAAQQLKDLEDATAKAFATGAESDIAKYNEAAAAFVATLAAISEGLGALASREIKIRFEAQGPAAALALANWYKSGGELTGLSQTQLLGQTGLSFNMPGRASGGSVGMGSYLVGERGPEILTLGQNGGFVTPLGGGGPNVTINMPAGANGDDVVRALQNWTRNNGALPLATTTNIRR